MSEKRRPPIVGRYLEEEVALATRNSGMPLEALRYDVTPAGLHDLLIHFDIPEADAASWKLRVEGLAPPGIPDFFGRRRTVDAGEVEILGRAWSGDGDVKRVEFSVDVAGFGNDAAQRVEVSVR